MSDKKQHNLGNDLNTIWTIASKDILDALKNKVVVSMIIMLTIILLVPKLLPLIFEQPQLMLPVYDRGDSRQIALLNTAPDLNVLTVRSEQEIKSILCSSLYPEIGLTIPDNFDQLIASGGQTEVEGYVCWSKRFQIDELVKKLENRLSQELNQQMKINENILFPSSERVLPLSITTINSVLMILMMGIFLVPSLLIEEKEAKTMQALLVSPASIGQVVMGKALAGGFYILVTALVMFTITWVDVIHFGLIAVFVFCGSIFSVAVGLILGSFYEKQQDMVGWITAILIILVGASFVKMLDMELPLFFNTILPWVPSVALSEICRAIFMESVPTNQIVTNLLIILAVSTPLYGIVIWKVQRSYR